MTMPRIAGLAIALALSTVPSFAQSPAIKPGNPGNGKRLFIADGCYQCHGLQGQGGAAAPVGSYAPRLAPPKLPVEAIRVYVRHPTGSMPPYTAKVLSDSEIDDISAFLRPSLHLRL
jgi:mono/diheme cytochrome c family protein